MSLVSRDTKGLRMARVVMMVIAAIALLVVVAVIMLYLAVRASLPQLNGEQSIPGLSAKVSVTRDAQGTASIVASTQLDATRALGFVHAQERFFEMDLARRSAAGELSALLGKATLKADQDKRMHRFRARLSSAWQTLPVTDRDLLQAYADGVNAGLAALPIRPWQYVALRMSPEKWQPVDSLLVIAEMYSMLQLRSIDQTFADAVLREEVGDKLFQWLKPRGGEWDGALDGSVMRAGTLPTATEIDVRKTPARPASGLASLVAIDEIAVGSNAWAISGALTAHGGAMLANDMHLGLHVPNIWFRAQLDVGKSPRRRVVGVTLPGIPGVVVGSNGDIAWGFTNSYGRWFDWVPATGLATTDFDETISIKGETSVNVKIRETSVGPIAKRHNNIDYALAWIAHRPGSINLRMAGLTDARDVNAALAIANGAGMPQQNMMLVDRSGNVAWTIAGQMPQRKKVSLESPRAGFADVATASYVALDPAKYPRIKNPQLLRVWSGNNRQLAGDAGALIGDGGFDLGARGKQIRDRLLERGQFNESQLLEIQYDNEARFMKRWAALVKFSPEQTATPATAEVLAALATWNGRADVDQVAYRFIRAFRERIHTQLWKSWTDAAGLKSKLGSADARFEYPVWQALSARPAHLLPKGFTSWETFLHTQAVTVRDELVKSDGSIAAATWGARNAAAIKHPFAKLIPALAPYLDMPRTPMPGDNHMPNVAAPAFGASQRLAVSPGREKDGILTMPGGQSGHPLSPFYGAGHREWLNRKPSPLLAGPAIAVLRLQ